MHKGSLSKISCFFLATFIFACSRPLYDVDVVVVDEKQQPVTSASVTVSSHGWGVNSYLVWDKAYSVSGTTNKDGRFQTQFLAAPIGFPSGGQNPLYVSVEKAEFDRWYGQKTSHDGKVKTTITLQAIGTQKRKRDELLHKHQEVTSISVRDDKKDLVIVVQTGPTISKDLELEVEVKLRGKTMRTERISLTDLEKTEGAFTFQVNHQSLLDFYAQHFMTRREGIADDYVSITAKVLYDNTHRITEPWQGREMKKEVLLTLNFLDSGESIVFANSGK